MTQAWDFVDANILWQMQNRVLSLRICEQDLSVRVQNVLRQHSQDGGRTCRKIETIGDLIELTPSVLMRNLNFGRTSLNEIRMFLAEHNLTLKDDPTGLEYRSEP
jgi:DNA-directed RNA polymerase alpha subunit